MAVSKRLNLTMTYTLDKPQRFTRAGLDWHEFKALQQAFTDLIGVRIS
ncbi:MAG: hypothetical protein AAFQ40_03060 [Cyanobacteria bacterium J06623_5]